LTSPGAPSPLANIRAKLPDESAGEVMAHQYAVRDAPTLDAARAAADRPINTYRREYPVAVGCFEADLDALLAIHRVPVRHRIRVRTTNLAERSFVEERRRTKVIGRVLLAGPVPGQHPRRPRRTPAHRLRRSTGPIRRLYPTVRPGLPGEASRQRGRHHDESTRTRLGTIHPALLRNAGIGGLLGGTGLFLVMAGYYAANKMGFWAILNACFAAFVYKNGAMSSMAPMPGQAGMGQEMMGGQHIVASTATHIARRPTAALHTRAA
jgi:hypothetical protein